MRVWSLLCCAAIVCSVGCVERRPSVAASEPLTRAKTELHYLRDGYGRYLYFNGVNVSGSTKKGPVSEVNGIPSYVGRPFPLAEAASHFARLRDHGFNVVRLLVMWEGVEPVAKGQYDQEYLTYIRELVRVAGEHGLYVLLDMHQDMFSRHLYVKYNERPSQGTPGSIEHSLLSLVQPYTNRVEGDGAPLWAVKACLQEKKFDSPFWGTPRILSGLDRSELENIYDVYQKLSTAPSLAAVDGGLGAPDGGAPSDGGFSGELPSWVVEFAAGLPDSKFEVDEATDQLPLTNWTLTIGLSMDAARSYACLFAGDVAFPSLTQDGVNVKEYLQSAYAGAWAQVAKQVKDLPNVLGYDIINEPGGNFLVLSAAAALIKAGAIEGAQTQLKTMLGNEMGAQVYRALLALRLLPPDSNPETLRKWGLDKLDTFGVIGLNNGFNENHMRPFYERMGRAILAEDPNAIIFFEEALSISNFIGGGSGGLAGQFEVAMQRPELPQVVFAPHWYPDIYPYFGFNVPPRQFTADQMQHRDYEPNLDKARHLATYSFGNIPVVFGEFGSYFNFNSILESRNTGYAVTGHVLDNYYEAFEHMFEDRILWCYSPENTYQNGEGWNKEDFSILDPNLDFRAARAWARPVPRALAGKPISVRFHSDYHFFDPQKGVANAEREFEVRYASAESEAPSEISVPAVQYPDGFYVWVSDGQVFFDPARAILFHYPSRDEPLTEHWVRLRPAGVPGQENDGWRYFFKGTQVLTRN